MIQRGLIYFAICTLFTPLVASDELEWRSSANASVLRYNNKTNQIEDTVTPVSQRCKCDFSNCDCFIEYINWNNQSKEARIYFRIDPIVPKKIFTATVFDDNEDVSQTFQLNDGMNCKTFKTKLFDKFCLKVYGRASYSDFTRICLQMGVIIRRDNVVSSDIECIKAWPNGATHMQPSSYENPSLSELNHQLYKLRYSSATNIGPPSILALIIFSSIIQYILRFI